MPNYICCENGILLKEQDSFNIEQILECGQCFRFYKNEEMSYRIIARGRELFIKQSENGVFFYPCDINDFENIWVDYFDLNTDYNEIKNAVSTDEIMKKAVEYGEGIRLLNQEPYEALISFIISQNNNIPRIKGIIERMSEKYGTKYGGGYLFPTLEQLKGVSTEEIFELRVGFRARYIRDCLDKLILGEVDLYNTDCSTEELCRELMQIKGVGQKVADCVMLFSMRRREVFPTDVWVKRVMSELYFGGEDTDIKSIHSLAAQKWGKYAGYAQQYLFYYAREEKIGINK